VAIWGGNVPTALALAAEQAVFLADLCLPTLVTQRRRIVSLLRQHYADMFDVVVLDAGPRDMQPQVTYIQGDVRVRSWS
jgi:hypothetical protein